MTDTDQTDSYIDQTGSEELDRSDHHKHMDYVQAIISRLANNSFLLKGWTLTLCSAILGFAITQRHAGLALTALIPLLAFWILDTYYLRQERGFRDMYRDIAQKQLRGFEIYPRPYSERHRWWRTAFSVSLRCFYPVIAVLAALVAFVCTTITTEIDQNQEGSRGVNKNSVDQSSSEGAAKSDQSPTNSAIKSATPAAVPTAELTSVPNGNQPRH